jgi:hypothetical protein
MRDCLFTTTISQFCHILLSPALNCKKVCQFWSECCYIAGGFYAQFTDVSTMAGSLRERIDRAMTSSRFIPENPSSETDDPKIADLTVSQLQELIRQTVQEAVAEVLIEFSIAAEADARITEEADMMDYLRTLQPAAPRRSTGSSRADD